MLRILLVLALAACTHAGGGAGGPTARPTTADITGLARDHDTGYPVVNADVRLRAQGQLGAPARTLTNASGMFSFSKLPPGKYELVAEYAGQPVTITNIDLAAGDGQIIDVVFTLGRVDPITHDFNDPKASAIDRYHPPKGIADGRARVEGTVSELGNHLRVAGAVVNIVLDQPNANALQGVTDDQGRYHFDDIAPGTYIVSAYYNVSGRGQIEVRRSAIDVAAGDAVVVPLWIEAAR